ncbi:MAG: hypothetical protein IJ660_05245 [Alphaproteobacteria bacterium]|nr:hypothetical protein [Alphaproteobacteria bacterium]
MYIGKKKIFFGKSCIALYATSLFMSSSQAAIPVSNFNALYNAASNRKVDIISRAIARGMDIDSTDYNGNTGLCQAIRRNDVTAYRVFLHFGANPNHSCILRIPRSQYSYFVSSIHQYQAGDYSASARYAKGSLYSHNAQPYRNVYQSKSWLSSPITWTIGGLALIGGGIALAGGGGGGKHKIPYIASSGSGSGGGGGGGQDIDFDFSQLHGVGGTPVRNKNNITRTVSEQSESEQSSLWAIYASENKDIINTGNINVYSGTDSLNTEHWGGIYAKNGYIFNAGVITVESDNYYAAGLMACVVNSYNPANTACFVNADNDSSGDIYNQGKINVTANQSSGIFTSGKGKVTNTGEINMNGRDDSGIFVYGSSDGVVNDGTITLVGQGTDYLAGSMNGIWVAETADITNNNKIKITNTEYTANGMYSKDGTITNNGEIEIESSGVGLKTHNGTLQNKGKISIINTNSNDAYGMKIDNTGTSTNTGEINIVGSGYGMYMTEGTQTNEAEGVITLNYSTGYAMGGNGTSTNKGKIISSGGGMVGNNVINNNIINSNSTGLNTTNKALNTGTISSYGLGMFSDTTGSELTNTGTIESGTGVSNKEGTTSNSGTIKTTGKGITHVKGDITNSGTITTQFGEIIDTAESNVTNTADAVMSTQNSVGISAINKTIQIDEDTEQIYSANLNVNNAGTVQLQNGGIAILTEGDNDNAAKLTVDNSGSILIDNKSYTGKIAAISSITENSESTITNNGEITINNYESGYNNSITGIEIAKGTITNNGTLTITNSYFDEEESNSSNKPVIGIKINEGEAVNNNKIIINSNNAIGMLAEYIADDGEEVGDDEVKVKAINRGTIEMNGTNNIAMYAQNKGAVVTNAGTIVIKKPNLTDIYQKYGDTAYDETDDCNAFICLANGGTYINSGVVTSNRSLNFNKINGKTLLSLGSRISAPSISGTVYTNYDLVTDSFEDTYVTDDDSFEGDTDNLEIISLSPMFTASLLRSPTAPLRSSIQLQRRSFYEFTKNSSAAQYLEMNYQQKNNLALFDKLKTTENTDMLSQKIDENLGLKLFPNFAKQDVDTIRLINSDISERILANTNTDDIRTMIGFDTHYRRQDKTADQYGFDDRIQSVYGVFDKKYTADLRLGLGLNYVKSDSKYDSNNKRKNNLLQAFAPFIYHDALYQFMSTPHLGILWGNYHRHTDDASYRGNTKEVYYGITNELRRDIALEKFILEPTAELNIAGLYIDDIHDNMLKIKGHNEFSAEVGIGLYLKKMYTFDNHSSLSFRAGGSTYLELLNPYRQLHGSLAGMSGKYRFNRTAHSRARSVFKTSVKYQKEQMNLIGELNKYIEDADGYEVNLRMQYDL